MTTPHCIDWAELRRIARSLNLPSVHEGSRPDCAACLYAHDRLWTWWDPAQDAPGFRLPAGERAFLIAADPRTFFVCGPDIAYDHVLARPDRVSKRWILANLSLSWRVLAPSAFLDLFPGAGPPVPQFADY